MKNWKCYFWRFGMFIVFPNYSKTSDIWAKTVITQNDTKAVILNIFGMTVSSYHKN